MGRPAEIQCEPVRDLSAIQECRLLRAATRGGIAPTGIRRRLALLLNQLDAFDETIALLAAAPVDVLKHDELLLLASAYLERRHAGDADRALKIARAAQALAESDSDRSEALTEQAAALFQLERRDSARGLLERAIALDPANRVACKRLTTELMSRGEAPALLALVEQLIARGAGHHAGLLAAQALALAQIGRTAAARDVLNLDAFLIEDRIDPPDGWGGLANFNAALAGELLASPSIRDGRHGTASVATRRIDSLVAGGGPLARLLIDRIIAAVHHHVAPLSAISHPWIAAAPAQALIRSWCVITGEEGYERWHMHPFGWMSGVYYVQVPETVSAGTGSAGCLMVGLPDSLVDARAAARVGHRLVRPQPGLLALFPSHSFHRTFPQGTAKARVCVAFDIGAWGAGES